MRRKKIINKRSSVHWIPNEIYVIFVFFGFHAHLNKKRLNESFWAFGSVACLCVRFARSFAHGLEWKSKAISIPTFVSSELIPNAYKCIKRTIKPRHSLESYTFCLRLDRDAKREIEIETHTESSPNDQRWKWRKERQTNRGSVWERERDRKADKIVSKSQRQ